MELKMRQIVQIRNHLLGLVSSRSTTVFLFIMRQMQEKITEKEKRLFNILVGLRKVFDMVPLEFIKFALQWKLVYERLVRQVLDLYRCRVRTVAGTSEEFKISVGVHQGSPLSPLLFVTVMEEATKEFGEVAVGSYSTQMIWW